MSREIAQQVLMDKLSQNEQFLIEEIETLPERLIDCMIEYHKQFKTLGLLPVSNNEVAVCKCDNPNKIAEQQHGLVRCRQCKQPYK